MSDSSHRAATLPEEFAVVQNLTQRGDLAGTFARLGEILAPSKLRAALKVQLLDDQREPARRTSYFTVTIGGGKAKVTTDQAAKADIELITTPETWWEIAAGKLAPHEAFRRGRMRVRGDFGLAQDLLKHAAGSRGRTHLCKGRK